MMIMKNAVRETDDMDEVITHEYAKQGSEEEGVNIVKMHAKTHKGPAQVEALVAGGTFLPCVSLDEEGNLKEVRANGRTSCTTIVLIERRGASRWRCGEEAEGDEQGGEKRVGLFTLFLNSRYKAATAARYVARGNNALEGKNFRVYGP
jgi:hypothetical protein